jgi:hypothetical protein
VDWMNMLGSPVSNRQQPPWSSATNIRQPGEISMSKQNSLERQRFARVADMAVQVEARLAASGAPDSRRAGGALTESPPAHPPAAVQQPHLEGYLMLNQNGGLNTMQQRRGTTSHSGALLKSLDRNWQQPPASAAAIVQPVLAVPRVPAQAQSATQPSDSNEDLTYQCREAAQAVQIVATQPQQDGILALATQVDAAEQNAPKRVSDTAQAATGTDQGHCPNTIQSSVPEGQSDEPRESVGGGEQGLGSSSGSPQRVLKSELRGSRVRWAPDVQEAVLPVVGADIQEGGQHKTDRDKTSGRKTGSSSGKVRRQMSRLGSSTSGNEPSKAEVLSRSGSDASTVVTRPRTSGGVVGDDLPDDVMEAEEDGITPRHHSMVRRTFSRVNSRSAAGMSPVTLAAHLLSSDALSLQLGPSRANSFHSMRSSLSQTRRSSIINHLPAYLPDQTGSPSNEGRDKAHLGLGPATTPTHCVSADGHVPCEGHLTTQGADRMFTTAAATYTRPSAQHHLHQHPVVLSTPALSTSQAPVLPGSLHHHHQPSGRSSNQGGHPQSAGQATAAHSGSESPLSRIESPSILRKLKLWLTRVTGPKHSQPQNSTGLSMPHPPHTAGRSRASPLLPTAQHNSGTGGSASDTPETTAGSVSIGSQENRALHVGASSETRPPGVAPGDHLHHGARSISIHYSEPPKHAGPPSWFQAPLQASHSVASGGLHTVVVPCICCCAAHASPATVSNGLSQCPARPVLS